MSAPPRSRPTIDDVDAVIYDLDGTIVHTEPVAAIAIDEVLKNYGTELTDAIAHQFVGLAWPDVLQVILDNLTIKTTPEKLHDEIETTYQALLRNNLPTLPGAVESMRALAKVTKLGLVSGSSGNQIAFVLNELGVADLFAGTFGIESYNEGKPSPAGFLLCAKELGVEPKRCVVLEDSTAGISSAKAAGMWAVAITAGNHANQDVSHADERFATLTDFMSALLP